LRTQITLDIATVELCGALKNVVALAAGKYSFISLKICKTNLHAMNAFCVFVGFCDGLGVGSSAKAAVLRQGLQEMALFCQIFGETQHFQIETIMMSCGVADLFASCCAGRNRLCAAEFALRSASLSSSEEPAQCDTEQKHEQVRNLWHEVEKELLKGQHLQGVETCAEVMHLLTASGHLQQQPKSFPLFRATYRAAFEGFSCADIFHWD
jgi:glycerol-3-phosphate dehydrogenase (NAD+)